MTSNKRIFLPIVILLLVILGVWLFTNTGTSVVGNVSGQESIASLDRATQKKVILDRVNNNKITTEADKAVLLEVLDGAQFREYGFTLEEQERIIAALNQPTQ